MSSMASLGPFKGSAFEVLIIFLKLGLTSFGGPIAHIGYFRQELVARRQWLNESQFSQLLAISQFLPGPASSQLGFALGLLRAGWLGALAAFIGFTLPSVLLLLGFVSLLPWMSADIGGLAIHGLKLVACAVVADAVIGMFKKLCPDLMRRGIALLVLAILILVNSAWTQIGVVLLGAVAGLFLLRESAASSRDVIQVRYGKRIGLLLFAIFCVLLLLLLPQYTQADGLTTIASTFYQAGAMVFGGGHVVLPLLEQSVVANGWVSNESFLAGYGASQAIPGPMFAFAAYLGALIPGDFHPWLGAMVALLFMFLPGFLLMTAAIPLWQTISQNALAANAIAGVNAAVVGILAAALYDPIFTSGLTSITDILIVLVAFLMLAKWKLSSLLVVLWCVLTSVLLGFI
ncbi:chromate efflux transporter [Alteromonadaceae bacterium BrNp21-10]|nr:chromate efflux transporter [Alteromonadaceae bacterium BrNp21-10]